MQQTRPRDFPPDNEALGEQISRGGGGGGDDALRVRYLNDVVLKGSCNTCPGASTDFLIFYVDLDFWL